MNAEKEEDYTNFLYVKFRDIPPPRLFIYILCILIVLLLSRQLSLNIYLMLILGMGIILLYISKFNLTKKIYKSNLHDKLNDIFPRPLNIDKYPDLIELFYGTKRLSELNPRSFANVIYNTDAVIEIYNNITKVRNSCAFYDIALERKKDALNAMSRFIFCIENDQILLYNLKQATRTLAKILNAFLKKIKEECDRDFDIENLTSESNIVLTGPPPYNSFNQYEYF